jgi:hypothetical protein
MLDAVLGRLFGPALEVVARRVGRGATALALVAFVAGLAAVPLIAWNLFWTGGAVFLASRLLAGIASRASAENASVGPVLAAVNFAALPFGFALGDPVRALPAVFLMFGLSAQSAATLRYGRGWIADTELLIAFAVMCVFPDRFSLIAYIIGVACFVSAGVRIAARRSL